MCFDHKTGAAKWIELNQNGFLHLPGDLFANNKNLNEVGIYERRLNSIENSSASFV